MSIFLVFSKFFQYIFEPLRSCPNLDKSIEMDRYDNFARLAFNDQYLLVKGSSKIPIYLREPYLHYEKLIESLIFPSHSVLEIGSGSGLHSYSLVSTSSHVTVSDISQASISCLLSRYANYDQLTGIVADMEHLPFPDESFDFICCAGSLSYGDNMTVMNEIYRLLKKSGYFICVDSWNSNPLYRFNRFRHYLFGHRSFSTLTRIPSHALISSYRNRFGYLSASYYGSLVFLAPILLCLVSTHFVSSFIRFTDKFLPSHMLGFKVVLLARKTI